MNLLLEVEAVDGLRVCLRHAEQLLHLEALRTSQTRERRTAGGVDDAEATSGGAEI